MNKAMSYITTLIALVFLAVCQPCHSDTTKDIATDYRAKAAEVCRKLESTLKSEVSTIVAKLVSAGDTVSASVVAKQGEAKLRGDEIPQPHRAVSAIFIQFDAAKLRALNPIRKLYLQRIDSLLKSEGMKNVEIGLALAKLRDEIESSVIIREATAKVRFPKKWDYFISEEMVHSFGQLFLEEDGTLILNGDTITKGTWQGTTDPNVLKVILQPEGKKEETGTIVIDGRNAIFDRSVGVRYLRAR